MAKQRKVLRAQVLPDRAVRYYLSCGHTVVVLNDTGNPAAKKLKCLQCSA